MVEQRTFSEHEFVKANKICFTSTWINDNGKKKATNIPSNWTKLEKSKLGKGNVLCVLTGLINDLTLIDFDSKEAYASFDKYLIDNMTKEERKKYKESYYAVRTGRGYHLYFKYEYRLPSKTGILPDVDIKNRGGMGIAPESWHPVCEKHYEKIRESMDINNIPAVPEIVVSYLMKDIIEKEKERREIVRATANGTEDRQLLKKLQLIPADNRDDWISVGMAIKNLDDRGFFEKNAFDMFDAWSQTSDSYGGTESAWYSFEIMDGYGWNLINELCVKYNEEKYKALMTKKKVSVIEELIGVDNSDASGIFSDIEQEQKQSLTEMLDDIEPSWEEIITKEYITEEETNDAYKLMFKKMNEEIFFFENTSTICMWKKDENNENFLLETSYQIAKLRYSNRFITAPVFDKHGETIKTKEVYAFDLWIRSPFRRSYSSSMFSPKHHINGIESDYLNLYHGMKYENDGPALSEDHPFLYHIKHRWCSDDKVLSDYVLNWFSWLIQKAGEKTMSALVLKSSQRAGKGIIMQVIMDIIGETLCFQPSSMSDVLGTFNPHVENKLLLFLDEMVWGGQKEMAGVLKKYITERKLLINSKGVKEKIVNNLFNVVIASNEDWVVPSGFSEQRFQVIQLSEELNTMDVETRKKTVMDIINVDKKQLYSYFKNRDITLFDPTQIIRTKAFLEQNLMSMDSVHKFLYELDVSNLPTDENDRINTAELYSVYKYYCDNQHNKFPDTNAAFHRKVRDFGLTANRGKVHNENKHYYTITKAILKDLWKKKK